MRWLILAVVLVGCGGPTPQTWQPAQLDVLHDVYLRGAPNAIPRVALTFDGLGPCSAPLLDRLASVPENDQGGRLSRPGLRATFFISPKALQAEELEPLRALLARMDADGHEIALGLDTVPLDWRQDPQAYRAGVRAAARALTSSLETLGVSTPTPRFWRPPTNNLSVPALGAAAEAARPAVLWSRRAAGDAGTIVAQLSGRLADGDIVALPGEGAGCPAVDAIDGIAAGLRASGLSTVTVSALLGGVLTRHTPLRLARYHGLGLPAACFSPLGLPRGDDAPEISKVRWGLVAHELDGAAQLMPLPIQAVDTAALLSEHLDLARAMWRHHRRWAALPACTRLVPTDRLLSPLTARAGARLVRWWAVGPDGPIPREPRALGAPSHPVALPTGADLVRIEARQRLPWRLRGVVGQALKLLGLEVPPLLEMTSAAGLVLRAPLAPQDLLRPDAAAYLRRAIAGYVQVSEISMGSYLFLAGRRFADVQLERTARAAEGFLPAGPYLVVPALAGGAPQARHVGPEGGVSLPDDPTTLLAAVLRSGAELAPGDVVTALPKTPHGAPTLAELAHHQTLGVRTSLRLALARSILRGLGASSYLRPGQTVTVDGGWLGRQTVRLAVPPGVALPSLSLDPLDDQPKVDAH